MYNYSFESGSDISHSLTSPRVIGIVSDKRADTSTLHSYSEQMNLDPMFYTITNPPSSVCDSVYRFNLITDCGTLE